MASVNTLNKGHFIQNSCASIAPANQSALSTGYDGGKKPFLTLGLHGGHGSSFMNSMVNYQSDGGGDKVRLTLPARSRAPSISGSIIPRAASTVAHTEAIANKAEAVPKKIKLSERELEIINLFSEVEETDRLRGRCSPAEPVQIEPSSS